ncbi:MAG: PAS domain S-box protein [Sandaracinaceae bacterium]|nr:MAG: PAS domain S-box protein [Sandaracinaceae bacterium]
MRRSSVGRHRRAFAPPTFLGFKPRVVEPERDGGAHALGRRDELILRCAGEGIYGVDREGITTFVNPAGAAMVGYRPEELMGKLSHVLIHHSFADGEHYEHTRCPIYAAFKDGAVHTVRDEVFWRKDGTSFPVEYVSTPIRGDEGELIGAVVTFRDVTERHEREAALREALAEVERLKEKLQEENEYLRDEISGHALSNMIGDSASLGRAKHRVEQVAPTDATVLILGETGVGKELFARAIHDLSGRREHALIKLNCAALPSTLIESELFGHEKGSFTGATTRRKGRFELADGGTIFLDEVGELPLELQAKLLRVLQEGELERLGGAETISVDVRVVAATNRDLAAMVRAGEFRDDLYYRLNVFPIDVPPLRERTDDIPALTEHFVQRLSSRLGKVLGDVSPACMEALVRYPWPGNIRELENVIERAAILAVDRTLPVSDALDARPAEVGGEAETGSRTLEEVERRHIQSVLEHTSWRIEGDKGAARILDLHPNTLRSRMKKLGIRRDAT